MSDLAEFLLARIAEDEAQANRAETEPYLRNMDAQRYVDDNSGHEGVLVGNERWLAECEAKRQLVDSCLLFIDEKCPDAPTVALSMLHSLALPYADHPDYREEWRP